MDAFLEAAWALRYPIGFLALYLAAALTWEVRRG